MAIINKTGIGTGNTIQAEHVTRIIDALSGVATTTTVIASGSFTGSFIGAATLNGATINGTLGQGLTVSANGLYAHAEGRSSIATGDYSHVEGYINTASGNYSHAEGEQTEAAGFGSHAEGALTTTIQRFSHAEGYGSTASGSWSHAEGEYTTAFGTGSHSEGYYTVASGNYSHAEGKETLASGRYSLAIGQFSTATADQSFASGYDTLATANGAHAQGQYTTASGNYSHAEGRESHASGFGSHAEGYQTSASGDYSYASGADSIARGSYSRAEGVGTIASGSGQHVTGKYNLHGDSTSLFIIGDGTSTSSRSDVFKAKTGAIEITGSLSILKNGGALNLVGTDHTYIQMYPDGFAAGRKAYIGYASAPENDLTIANEFTVSESGIRFKIGGSDILYMSGSGNVGIGNYQPWTALDVKNIFSVHPVLDNYTDLVHNLYYDSVAARWRSKNGGPGTIIRPSGGSVAGSIEFLVSGDIPVFGGIPGTLASVTSSVCFASTGRVGIGTTTPNYQLELSTNSAGKPGAGGLWTVTSDIRLKDNIEEANYDTCYDIVKNLPLKRYTWKLDAYTAQQIADRTVLGWIAQDVQPIFPKAVTSNSFSGSGDFYLDDCLSLDAGQINAALYGAVKKLIAENESLKSELQTIKTHLGL